MALTAVDVQVVVGYASALAPYSVQLTALAFLLTGPLRLVRGGDAGLFGLFGLVGAVGVVGVVAMTFAGRLGDRACGGRPRMRPGGHHVRRTRPTHLVQRASLSPPRSANSLSAPRSALQPASRSGTQRPSSVR
ncbi:hypothetical protein [Streptomyces iconiensis]|uniref:Uncharacterized protein n=1 Tax=Streptomyces iconiensis TaxID=1384038 RepID=A0ABT7A588_9ACTN|nr:hypothetical protein [Streptomyces iconiensis]MDJ1136518.1 hypothetical protein [Streptomyces iconiensis]